MKFPKLSNKDWVGWAVIVCIGVTLFVLLSNISSVIAVLARIIGYFRPVILGVIIAYIVSPLTKLFFYRVLRRMRHRRLRWYLSVFLSFALLLAVYLLLDVRKVLIGVRKFASRSFPRIPAWYSWILCCAAIRSL